MTTYEMIMIVVTLFAINISILSLIVALLIEFIKK